MSAQTVTLTEEEVATAVAGMQFWAKSIDDYADRIDGAATEANRDEARRIRRVAAKLAIEYSAQKHEAKVTANGL